MLLKKTHQVLQLLLISRDKYFHAKEYKNHERLLGDELRALLSNDLIAAYINTPDEDDVTMLQRAAAFLDIDVVRLLLQAGADANVPFSATKRCSNDESDLTVPFLPFQIACWVSRTLAYPLESRQFGTENKPDAVPTQQKMPERSRNAHIVHRVSRLISHAAEAGAKQMRRLKHDPVLTEGAKRAESLRAGALSVAQELLRWHLLRNDNRFEGITEFHICVYVGYVSRSIMLVNQDYKVADAKASWPGLEGKYTGLELARNGQLKDEWSTFPSNVYRLRGKELALKRIEQVACDAET